MGISGMNRKVGMNWRIGMYLRMGITWRTGINWTLKKVNRSRDIFASKKMNAPSGVSGLVSRSVNDGSVMSVTSGWTSGWWRHVWVEGVWREGRPSLNTYTNICPSQEDSVHYYLLLVVSPTPYSSYPRVKVTVFRHVSENWSLEKLYQYRYCFPSLLFWPS